MNKEQLSRAIGEADDNAVANAAQPVRHKTSRWLKGLTAAACLALVLVAAAAVLNRGSAPQVTPIAPLEQQEGEGGAMSDMPGGMVKFLLYNGSRYAYLEDAAPFNITEEQLGESLGTLQFDIMADPQANGGKDFAATFGIGGELRQVKTYDPAFRLAVTLDGHTYLCQHSDTVGEGEPMTPAQLFEAADFAAVTTAAEIRDHFGSKLLDTVEGRELEPFLTLLSQSENARLTDGEYEAVGHAQTEGKSFLVTLRLADTTGYEMYMVPSLGVVSFGNDRCRLSEEFLSAYGEFFAALEQPGDPIMN